MSASEELEDMREELRKNLGPVKNHCPFGCGVAQLDEHGYCEHLVGFTNQPSVGGVVEPIVTNPMTEMLMVNGRHKRKPKTYRGQDGMKEAYDVIPASNEKVLPGDKLVNPEEVQLVNGVQYLAKKWVSSRVYRKAEPVKKSA